MDNSQTRQLAGNLLGQLAEIIGVSSPVSSNSEPGALTSPSATSASISERSEAFSNVTTSPNISNSAVLGANILSEARQLLAPYPRMMNAAAFRMSGRTPNRSTATATQPRAVRPPITTPRPWYQRFCCLSGPAECKTPSSNRLVKLKVHGLGDEPVTSDCRATSSALESDIRLSFPALGSAGFELLIASTGGCGKPLVRLSNNVAIPSAEQIRSQRRNVIYVRPLTELIPEEDAEDRANGEDELAQEPAGIGNLNEQISQTRSDHEIVVASTSASVRNDQLSQNGNLDGPLTVDEFRMKIYEENPGIEYIRLSRDNFVERLLGVYKNPTFNFSRKPMVEFVGESGTDIGALTKEFFWKGLTSLIEDKLDGRPIFEGQEGSKIPSCDARLTRSGIFKVVGKFMGHCILHSGIGFIGLSQAIAEYLIAEKPDSDSPFSLILDDCSEIQIRDGLEKLLELQRGASLSEEDYINIKTVADSSEFNESITKENAQFAYQHILYHTVIEKRISQLEAIKEGLRATGILDFIKGKNYLVHGIFPRIMDLQYPASLVVDKIESNCDHELKEHLLSFIYQLETRPGGIQKLLCAWTGWALIPESSLKVNILPDVEFIARACFNELIIPSTFTKEDLLTHMEILVNDGHCGFGSI